MSLASDKTALAPPVMNTRYVTIDGLRGIASMMVAVYHLAWAANLNAGVGHVPENPYAWLGFGIEIFFVISGFVITHSIRNAEFSGRYFGLFALRRAIRLDPPYWATIMLEVFLVYLSLQFFTNINASLPSPSQFALHFFYLQSLAGYMHIVPVFWSLVYEFQFYLVLVGSMVVLHSLFRKTPAMLKPMTMLFGTVLYSVSLLTYLGYINNPLPELFLNRWYQFMCGSLAWLYLWGHVTSRIVITTCLLTIIAALVTDIDFWHKSSTILVSLMCLSLCSLGRRGLLVTLLSGPGLQFLGRISYSLFLIHVPIGSRFIAVCLRTLPEQPGVAMRVTLLGAGLCVSIIAAWLFYIVLERPSLKFAHRVRLPASRS